MRKKKTVPDYSIPGYDENIPDYGLDDLFEEEGIPPQNEKQLVPYGPPTHEETLAHKLKEGKEIYVDPQYLPELEDLPPEYDDNEVPDCALDNEDNLDNEDEINLVKKPLKKVGIYYEKAGRYIQ